MSSNGAVHPRDQLGGHLGPSHEVVEAGQRLRVNLAEAPEQGDRRQRGVERALDVHPGTVAVIEVIEVEQERVR